MDCPNAEPKRLKIKVQVRMPASQRRNDVRHDNKRYYVKNRRDKRHSGIACSCSRCTSRIEKTVASRGYVQPYRRDPTKTRSYRRIKWGLKKSNPAAIVLWVFHKVPSSNGLTAKTVIAFLKTRYILVNNPLKVGKCIGSMLRCAVEFGLLRKHGDKYFLKRKARPLSA